MSTESSLATIGKQASTQHIVVDRRFAAILEEDFALPATTVLDAFEGELQKQGIGICSWASRQENPARALLCWAAKHYRGRHRRCTGAGTGRPSRDRRHHGPGQDIAAPRTVSPGPHRGYGLNAAGILAALERMAG